MTAPTSASSSRSRSGAAVAEAERAQPPGAERVRGAPGLPHRPLPGQGDRPERPGVPLRQRDLRAALEPQLHRPRPDHGVRGPRHRLARGLLRQRRCAARPRAEPHAAAPVPAVHGAAGHVHRRRGARREGRRSCTRSRRRRSRPSRTWPCARSTRRARSAARTRSATSTRRACPQDSHTETYAALRLEVDNWRWAGVPMYLRTGKRLARKVTEIAVVLKPVPHLGFQQDGTQDVRPNQLVMTVQPNEGVSLSLGAKVPGTRMRIRPVNMEFLYGTAFMSRVPRGLRAPDPRRHARRRDALHAQRRGRGAVADHRPDRAGVGGGSDAGGRDRHVRVGHPGAGGGEPDPAGRREVASHLMAIAERTDSLWSERDTTPAAIEEALRDLLAERHAQSAGYVPARALNLVCIVDREWSGEIANRLRGIGRFHASRTIVCAYERGRRTLDATASIATDGTPEHGDFELMRETVVVNVGPEHLAQLDRIVDPIVVTDVPTVVWAPHGHPEAVDALLSHRAGRAAGLRRRPGPARRAGPRVRAGPARVRRRPRLAAHDAVARARRGGVRPARSAAGARHDLVGHRADPGGLGGRGPALPGLAVLAPGLEAGRDDHPPRHAARPRAGAPRGGASSSWTRAPR